MTHIRAVLAMAYYNKIIVILAIIFMTFYILLSCSLKFYINFLFSLVAHKFLASISVDSGKDDDDDDRYKA